MYINKSRKNSRVSRSLLTSPILSLTVILAVVLAADNTFAKITKGPFLLRVAQDRAALMWETDIESPGKISYGKNQKLEKCIDTIPEKVEYELQKDQKPAVKEIAFIHKVWLKELEPGETYTYNVADGQDKSESYEFRTAPAKTSEVRFVVYGDSRSRPQTHRKIVEQIIKAKVDFVVNTGDLVSRGGEYEQWGPQFFDPLKGLAESVPVYVAKGNHDRDKNQPPPHNFEKLMIPPGEKNNYGFDYGPLHYFCVDHITEGLNDTEELLDLITTDAQNSKAQWKFVSFHVPALYINDRRTAWGYPKTLPSMAKAGVDFVAVGHSHRYERFRPVAPLSGTDGSFVTYITTGGGGASLYDITPSAYHVKAEKVHHFCLFHIKGNKLTMDAIDIDGKVIDHFEITKETDGRLNKEYLQTAVSMEAIRLNQDLYRTWPTPLAAAPKKNQPFTIIYKFSVPTLTSPAKITFKLRSEQGNYQLPKPKTVVIPEEGGTINVELTVTPLVEVKVPTDKRGRAQSIIPALWLDCHYAISRTQESVSHRVVAKPKKPKQP